MTDKTWTIRSATYWLFVVVFIGGGLFELTTGRVLDWIEDTRANNRPVEAHRPRPDNAGQPIFPYENRATRQRMVRAAFFQEMKPSHPDGFGESRSPHEIRFTAKDFDTTKRLWSVWVSEIVLTEGEAGSVKARLIDPSRANERVFGELTLQFEDGNPVSFGKAWLTIDRE